MESNQILTIFLSRHIGEGPYASRQRSFLWKKTCFTKFYFNVSSFASCFHRFWALRGIHWLSKLRLSFCLRRYLNFNRFWKEPRLFINLEYLIGGMPCWKLSKSSQGEAVQPQAARGRSLPGRRGILRSNSIHRVTGEDRFGKACAFKPMTRIGHGLVWL